MPGDTAHVDYHTIGSAHSNDDSTAHANWPYTPKNAVKFHDGTGDGGFALVTVSKAGGFVVEHYNGDGTLLYTAPARQPRKSTTALKRQEARPQPLVATA